MKSNFRSALATGLAVVVASATVLTIAASPAVAATPPFEPDTSNQIGTLAFYNAAGTQITTGSTTADPFSKYAVTSNDDPVTANNGATLYGYLPVSGVAPGNWSGEQLSSTTAFPVTGSGVPASISGQGPHRPVITNAPGDTTLAQLALDIHNTAPAGNAYQGLYQLRVLTQGNLKWWAADIQIIGTTWTQVYPTTSSTVPGTPTIGTATAGNASATVTFTAPAGNGGAAITGYTATANPGGATGAISGAAAAPITVPGLMNGTSYIFTVHATNSVGNSPESASTNAVIPTAPSGSTFTALATTRIFDASVGTTAVPVTVGGVGGVPADATAVAVNVEVFAPSQAGYLRVTPFGSDPAVAVQEFKAGQAISNLVVVKVVSGKIQAKVSTGSARVLMDVAGYYSSSTSGSTLTALPTARIFDATVGTTPSAVTIVGVGGVPSNATAVVVNVEVFAPSQAGYLRVTPFGSDPSVAVQEFGAGEAISNLVVVKVVGGKIQAKVSAGSARVLMDVAGYYS